MVLNYVSVFEAVFSRGFFVEFGIILHHVFLIRERHFLRCRFWIDIPVSLGLRVSKVNRRCLVLDLPLISFVT